jgi:hypothetical protein
LRECPPCDDETVAKMGPRGRGSSLDVGPVPIVKNVYPGVKVIYLSRQERGPRLENRYNPDLINPELFGNEAGEDEVPEVLNSYFLEKPEFHPFFSASTRLQFVRLQPMHPVPRSSVLSQHRRHLKPQLRMRPFHRVFAHHLLELIPVPGMQRRYAVFSNQPMVGRMRLTSDDTIRSETVKRSCRSGSVSIRSDQI